jgi:hypothetical protein
LQAAPLYLPEEHVALWESTKAGTVAAAPSSHNRSIRQSKKNSQIKVKRFHNRIVSAHISTPSLIAIASRGKFEQLWRTLFSLEAAVQTQYNRLLGTASCVSTTTKVFCSLSRYNVHLLYDSLFDDSRVSLSEFKD